MKNVKRTKLTEVQYRVAEGIALLNQEYGRSWLRKIDPERLALEDGNSCVLGQIEGEYNTGLNKLKIYEPSDYGFILRRGQRGRPIKYSTLTRTWKRSIKEMQKVFGIKPSKAEF